MGDIRAREIAAEIFGHMGGNNFLKKTGSYNLNYLVTEKGEVSLNMHLRKNSAMVKFLTITINCSDQYDMIFRKKNLSVVKEYKGLYVSQLRGIFTYVTGLVTYL